MKSIAFVPQHIRFSGFGIFLLLVCFASALSAQDRIILKNGNIIDAKVQEIQVSEVKYKRFDNLNGPVYTMQKSEIFMITYENGSKEVINEQTAPAKPRQSAPRSNEQSGEAGYNKRPAAQPSNSRRNMFMGGVTVPLKKAGAKTGFFAGYERYRPFSDHFSLLAHASFSLNKLVYQDYYFYYKDQEFNSRIMLGPMLHTANGTNMEFYGALMLGIDYQAYAGFEDKLLSLAFGAGAGMSVNDRLDINLRYISHTSQFAIPFFQVGVGVRF